MATTRWRKSLNLVEQLQSEPWRFDFFQATRLLERAAVLYPEKDQIATEPVALKAPPHQEAVHFRARQSLAFSPADVTDVGQKRIENHDDSKNANLQWQMEVAFMGLTGSQGVLPHHLSEMVISEQRKKNDALRDYFDLFNHRTISMFYQAWHKYQLPASYERSKQRQDRKPDLFTEALMSIAGIGTSELQYRLPVPDESIAGFAGLLGRNICSADSQGRMIRQFFNLDVEIEQFKGQWHDLPEDVRCQLPGPENMNRGINNQLGVSTVLGAKCYQAQSKFTVVVAPLNADDFMDLAPGSKKLEGLKSFIKMGAGVDMDFDIEVNLTDDHIPMAHLVDTEEYRPLLGWNTHMCEDREQAPPVSILLSQDMSSPDDGLPLAL
ncbi:type VI secretion system baseplate subunit TssG [Agaribacterium sp. ZY112]|uniref:type VI secretion system baseplate subunit TssG n=1 Tax=Agaribacterium sp. ZY112 TaxID=3233574 RepID=UPI003525BB2C